MRTVWDGDWDGRIYICITVALCDLAACNIHWTKISLDSLHLGRILACFDVLCSWPVMVL